MLLALDDLTRSMNNRIFSFKIPGFASQREWCVYIIIATSTKTTSKNLYVGKVGDNRDGCNPIISRIGNHLSHNRIHSQLRNKIKVTTDFDYEIHFATFGSYTEHDKTSKDKINELERQLNKLVQTKIAGSNCKLENPYHGKGYISASEKLYRESLLTPEDRLILQNLTQAALSSPHSS